MKDFIEAIKNWFSGPTYQSDMDQYVLKHYPRSTADVEYWERTYQRKHWDRMMWERS